MGFVCSSFEEEPICWTVAEPPRPLGELFVPTPVIWSRAIVLYFVSVLRFLLACVGDILEDMYKAFYKGL